MRDPTDHAPTRSGETDATLMTPPLRRDPSTNSGGDAAQVGGARAGAQTSNGATSQPLAGRYQLLERIAVGGMASVWRARDEILDRTVAVKLLHEHLALDEGFRARFHREAVTAAKLTHPHVVNLYDTGTQGESVFLVLELVEGQTLRDLIRSHGRIEPGIAASICHDVARALAYSHDLGLVHRDVKPANILLGNDGAVKVTDFGIAKADTADDLTRTGMVLGTAAYVAPEQVLGHPVDGQADQYALGCVLYEALAGVQPFRGETAVVTAALRLEREVPLLRDLSPDVPPALEAVVARATAREPADRFPSLDALADALVPFVDTDPNHTAALLAAHPPGAVRAEPTPSDGTPRPAAGRRARRGLPAAVLALVLLAGAIAAFLGGLLTRGEEEPPVPERAPVLELDETDLSAFDPQVGDGENEELLANLLDGDPTTYWQTEGYEGQSFENYNKNGVGFMVDLGEPMLVEAVELQAELPGVDVELRLANQRPTRIAGTRLVTSEDEAAGQLDLRPLGGPEPARYVLVWLPDSLPEPSDLPGNREGYHYAVFDDLRIRAVPDDEA